MSDAGTTPAVLDDVSGGDGALLAVAGGKGGCGKTTTTLGLAAAAARAGASPVAVDADVDVPDLHRAAGVERPREGNGDPTDAVRTATVPAGAATARVGVRPAPRGERALPATLARRAAAGADPGLLDCPAGAGRDAARPLATADAAVVVTTPAPATLRDAARTAAMAEAVGTPVLGAVVTRCERPPDGVGSLLSAPAVVGVPPATEPLGSPAAAAAYRRALARLRTGERG